MPDDAMHAATYAVIRCRPYRPFGILPVRRATGDAALHLSPGEVVLAVRDAPWRVIGRADAPRLRIRQYEAAIVLRGPAGRPPFLFSAAELRTELWRLGIGASTAGGELRLEPRSVPYRPASTLVVLREAESPRRRLRRARWIAATAAVTVMALSGTALIMLGDSLGLSSPLVNGMTSGAGMLGVGVYRGVKDRLGMYRRPVAATGQAERERSERRVRVGAERCSLPGVDASWFVARGEVAEVTVSARRCVFRAASGAVIAARRTHGGGAKLSAALRRHGWPVTAGRRRER